MTSSMPSMHPSSKKVVGIGSTAVGVGSAIAYAASYLNPYTAAIMVTSSVVVGATTYFCPLNYVIRGRVQLGGAANHGGVQVALTGGAPQNTVTAGDGTFSFTVPAGGNYVVTPTLAHHTFTPATLAFDNVQADQNAPFRSDRVSYAIHGRVTRSGGGLHGVRMQVAGDANPFQDTNQGDYDIPLQALGAYTVTPSLAHHAFTPTSRQVASLTARTPLNFTAALVNYTIGGTVTAAQPLDGVTMTLTGGANTAQPTANGGAYAFPVPATGRYTITPTRTHYTFAPGSRTIDPLTQNETANFQATLVRYRIRGRITLGSGAGVDNIDVYLKGDEQSKTVTAGGGYYDLMATALGDYTVAPSSKKYTFNVKSRPFNALSADDQGDFTATLKTFTIHCVAKSSGQNVAGVQIRVTGGNVDTTVGTDPNGVRDEVVPAIEDYQILCTHPDYTIDPAVVNLVALGKDTDVPLEATRISRTISGHVTDVTGPDLDGIEVRCSVFANTRKTTTAGGGLFTFPNVPSGRTGRVWIPDPHFTSNPVDVTLNVLRANQGNVDFVLTQHTFTISGTLIVNGVAGVGVQVDLTGKAVANVNSVGGGNYNFGARPSGGPYTVTPQRSATRTFHPFRAQIADLLANHVAPVFVGTRIDFGGGAHITTPSGGTLYLSAEARANIAGQREASHAIPLDVLADAADHALGRASHDGRGGYYFPITGRGLWLAFILNADRGHTLFTCYEKPQAAVRRDVGMRDHSDVVFNNWVANRHQVRNFTAGEDL